jgi:hypothetical protein
VNQDNQQRLHLREGTENKQESGIRITHIFQRRSHALLRDLNHSMGGYHVTTFTCNKLYNIYLYHPCGGGVEYLHRRPASRRGRRKENPVSRGITGSPCSWGIYIRGPGPTGWRSFESKTVQFGHEFRGTRTRECLR